MLENEGETGLLSFKGTADTGAGPEQFELTLPLYASVDKEASKINVSPRKIFLVRLVECAGGASLRWGRLGVRGWRRYAWWLGWGALAGACGASWEGARS